MVEYKRFVSYLYRYEGGQKERNAGFVRLEVRNRQCRIRIFLQHLPMGMKDGEAWVFRQADQFEMVPLGSFQVRDGAGEAGFLTQADNFMDTGFAVTAFSGLAVFLGEKQTLYLTAWDDTPLNLQEIRRQGGVTEAFPVAVIEQEEMEEQENPSVATVDSMSPVVIVEEKEAEQEDRSIEESEEEKGLLLEAAEQPLNKVRDEEEEPADPVEPVITDELMQSEAKGLTIQELPSVMEEPPQNLLSEKENLRDFNARRWWRQLLVAGTAAVQRYLRVRQQPVQAAALPEFAENTPEASAELAENVSEASAEAWKERGGISSERTEEQSNEPIPIPTETETLTWEKLSRIFPRTLPAGQSEEREFLQLSLQDIGRLPRSYWELGQNAFLLYGYANGHHLILMKDPKGECYLGVPGRDMGEDKLAAEMFGFRTFLRTGKKGYWLTGIKL